MDYAINRTYGSKQGRFTQVDPIGMSASSLLSPQTLNLYTYCGNDPINYTDPDGLFFGSFFKWLGKKLWGLVKKVIHAAVKAAGDALVAFIVSGFSIKAAAVAFVASFIKNLAFPKMGNILTPGWNPDIRHPLNGDSSLNRYIIQNFAVNDDLITDTTIFLNANFLALLRRISAVDAEITFCQVAREGHVPGTPIDTAYTNARSTEPSFRGLLQISPQAAEQGGLGNGKGQGIKDDNKVRQLNPDYIDGIYSVGPNIRAGSNYLKKRIADYGGNVAKGLQAYSYGAGTAKGINYANQIMNCAKKVKSGDIKGGLRVLYPKGKYLGL